MNSHSAPFVQWEKTRTVEKPTGSYTVIARRLKLATESVNSLGEKRSRPKSSPASTKLFPKALPGPFWMKAEPDLQARAVRRLEMEEADEPSVLVLDCERRRHLALPGRATRGDRSDRPPSRRTRTVRGSASPRSLPRLPGSSTQESA
jgi:hypothetical protein